MEDIVVKRLDDLREVESKRVDQLREAEAKRVDAIASTVAMQLAENSTHVNERLAALEKAQYQDAGSRGGRKDIVAWFFAALMALVAIASFLLPHLK